MSTKKPNPANVLWAVLAGWVVPGLGHILSGRKRQGIALLVIVGGAFLAGLVLSDFEAVSRDLHPIAFWAHIGVGGGVAPMLILDPAKKHVKQGSATVNDYETVPRFHDTGVLFCAIAGLLNVLVLLDLVDRMLGFKPVPQPPKPVQAPTPEGDEPQEATA